MQNWPFLWAMTYHFSTALSNTQVLVKSFVHILEHSNESSVVAERSRALDSSSSVVRMWVRIPAWPVAALVSLSTTLNHNCFVLRMGRKTAGLVCCVMHVKEPRTLIVKEKGACPGVSGFAPWAPSRVDMCALQIFCIIIIIKLSNYRFLFEPTLLQLKMNVNGLTFWT